MNPNFGETNLVSPRRFDFLCASITFFGEVARLCCICFLSAGTWRYRQGSHSDHHLQVWFATELIILTFRSEGFTAQSKTGGTGFAKPVAPVLTGSEF